MKKAADANALATARAYHSVTIVTGSHACQSARLIHDHRFLAQDAPLLPLDTCTHIESCHCIYLHHNDRRHMDRREDFLRSGLMEDDRRRGRDRRATGTWRQSNKEPSIEEIKNASREIHSLVESLVDGDATATLDDLYEALDRLREDVEFRVLLDSTR